MTPRRRSLAPSLAAALLVHGGLWIALHPVHTSLSAPPERPSPLNVRLRTAPSPVEAAIEAQIPLAPPAPSPPPPKPRPPNDSARPSLKKAAPSPPATPVQPAEAIDVASPAPAATGTAIPQPVTSPASQPPPSAPEREDLDAYLLELASRIRSAQRYPPMARRRGLEGEVIIALKLHRSGRVAGASVVGSAPKMFSRAALEAIERAGPFPQPPDGLPNTIVIPVEYLLD